MNSFPLAPLRTVTLDAQTGPFGSQLHSDDYVDDGIPVINPSNIINGRIVSDAAVTVTLETSERLSRHRLQLGDLVFARRGELGRAGVVHTGAVDWLCGTGSLRVRTLQAAFNSRFAGYVLQSARTRAYFEMFAVGSTMANLNTSIVLSLPVPLPELDEQRRIADFLDAETARIDRIIAIRQQQSNLQAERFAQLLDGVVIGDADTLTTIGYVDDAREWTTGKVARLFTIIPGFAFASEKFLAAGTGTRLLRGINVAPGKIDWTVETVGWDLDSSPIDRRFHLQLGDLVVGMDRPWIGTGSRVALIGETDIPSLLLQRVACIRPRSQSSAHYLRWVLASSHFRFALESETTGVSVPHISGEQIGAFTYPLPKPDDQKELAALLEAQSQAQSAQAELVNRQLAVLAERRQALITAAVTGGITV